MTLYSVIGGGGFIGRRMVRALRDAGAEVRTPARDGSDLFHGDLGRVIYCAGLTGDYRERPFETVEAHVTLLARLLEHGRFERLVYLSSTRLYQTAQAASGREDKPLRFDPNDREQVYELSKALGENLAVNRSQGRGTAARLSYVFDWEPGSAGFLSDWLVRARDRRQLQVASSPEDGRDYVHVDDVTAALRRLADSEANGIVNVASGRTTTNAEIAEVFRRAGWTVAFARAGAPPATPVDVERLAELGLRVRPPLALIEGYLAGL